mmetsp:Transcript_113493/g.196746  ORF Transcript_113493/g.196746 Transcript_113493/m.196746 type:complete len:224 (+) Transcript_113493:3756-4427(+)
MQLDCAPRGACRQDPSFTVGTLVLKVKGWPKDVPRELGARRLCEERSNRTTSFLRLSSTCDSIHTQNLPHLNRLPGFQRCKRYTDLMLGTMSLWQSQQGWPPKELHAAGALRHVNPSIIALFHAQHSAEQLARGMSEQSVQNGQGRFLAQLQKCCFGYRVHMKMPRKMFMQLQAFPSFPKFCVIFGVQHQLVQIIRPGLCPSGSHIRLQPCSPDLRTNLIKSC